MTDKEDTRTGKDGGCSGAQPFRGDDAPGKGKELDTGCYNKDNELYEKKIKEMYMKYPEGIKLPAEYASFFDENLLRLLIRLARYKFVARQLREKDRVLEVGCGSGVGSMFLSQHCAHVTGIDVKSTEIEEASEISSRDNVDFMHGDFFDMETGDGWDVVVALDVIEHLEPVMAEKLVERMSSAVRPGGMLVIGTPSFYSYEYQGPLSKASHIKCYDRDELLDLADQFFQRSLFFSMNDEMVHTGYHRMAWYYFVLSFGPK